MAGFYIHIPICKQVCYYCDFHFVASLVQKDLILQALLKEIKARSEYWKGITFSTIYFGGGTPSVLSVEEINAITNQIYKYYSVDSNVEFTFESNPDDLTPEYLKELKESTNINRLSIGIQSFHNKDLSFMNRRHSGAEARNSILNAQNAGLENITIDLIYGIPGLSFDDWKENLAIFNQLNIPHLAAYHLSIEPKTVFGVYHKKNKLKPVNEDISTSQYNFLIENMKAIGYEHYEISNFSKDDKFSEHNLGYWLGKKYIGIGPSAHSFNGNTRSWNISNNTVYCEKLKCNDNSYLSIEKLTTTEKFNDYLLTSLRTMWGADLQLIRKNFGELYYSHLMNIATKFTANNYMVLLENKIRFTEKGWFISDLILSELFYE